MTPSRYQNSSDLTVNRINDHKVGATFQNEMLWCFTEMSADKLVTLRIILHVQLFEHHTRAYCRSQDFFLSICPSIFQNMY